MTDPLRDPRFPGRPQHPDFWRISNVVLELDGHASEGVSMSEIVAKLIDEQSLTYMAEQRALWAKHNLPGLTMAAPPALAAIWLTAFAAGIRFQQEGGHREA